MRKNILFNVYKNLPDGFSGKNYVIKHNNKLYTVKKFDKKHPLYTIKNEYNAIKILNQNFPHQNFPKVFDIKTCDTQNYLLYQYIDGIDSRYLINLVKCYDLDVQNFESNMKRNSLTTSVISSFNRINHDIFTNNLIQMIKHYILNIAKLIKLCHISGITHLDIKPENIIISKHTSNFFENYDKISIENLPNITKKLFLIDFGFAKSIKHNDKELVYIKHRLGTLKYVSPEMLGKKYNCTSDVFSLGKILDEIIESTQFCLSRNNNMNEMQSLCNDMLISNPKHRITISEVIKNKWLCQTS